MKRNTKAVCKNCVYSSIELQGDDKTLKQMWCRKNAVISVSSDEYTGRVAPDYWCGDHPEFLLQEDAS